MYIKMATGGRCGRKHKNTWGDISRHRYVIRVETHFPVNADKVQYLHINIEQTPSQLSLPRSLYFVTVKSVYSWNFIFFAFTGIETQVYNGG
jgi:hypothetical protein